jgi:hypothetical protein
MRAMNATGKTIQRASLHRGIIFLKSGTKVYSGT